MSTGSAGQTSVKSEPNVVPMIDIMLVLLIIFMIVTPLLAAGFKATLPKGDNLADRPEEENEVVVGVDENGDLYLNTAPISEEVLEEQLRGIFAARTEDKIMYLKADQNIKYGRVQEAIEIGRRAGARMVASITESQNTATLLGGLAEEEE